MWLKTCSIACGSVLFAGVLGLTSWPWLQPAPAQQVPRHLLPDETAGKVGARIVELQKRKLEIAKKNYDHWTKAIAKGKERSSGIDCHWSKQWLDCERELHPERAVAALYAHRERVRAGYEPAKSRFDAGGLAPSEFGTYEYALAEAELWLLHEKEKDKR